MKTKLTDFLNEAYEEDSRYDIPASLEELFAGKDEVYYITDYSESMDNESALTYFLHMVNVSDEFVFDRDSTVVKLHHPDHEYLMVVHSMGGGDEFTHQYECSAEMRGGVKA